MDKLPLGPGRIERDNQLNEDDSSFKKHRSFCQKPIFPDKPKNNHESLLIARRSAALSKDDLSSVDKSTGFYDKAASQLFSALDLSRSETLNNKLKFVVIDYLMGFSSVGVFCKPTLSFDDRKGNIHSLGDASSSAQIAQALADMGIPEVKFILSNLKNDVISINPAAFFIKEIMK